MAILTSSRKSWSPMLGVLNILRHNSRIFLQDLFKNVLPNIGILNELGIPQHCVALLLTHYANLVLRRPEFFGQLVREVREIGFDPGKSSFVTALQALSGKEETWNRNQAALRRWGWSDMDIVHAFRLHPLCMATSEKKILQAMGLLVNKMGWRAEQIKSIIPRCSVVIVLFLKGLVKEEKLSLSTVISIPEKYFLYRFVNRYLDQVPQLLDVTKEKVTALGC